MTVSHASLTGADLHEPKGAASAASGTIYVADGAGSGAWTSPATLTSEVGKLQSFATPLVPSGWLECDGSTPLRSTYLDLFNAVSIQQTGSKNNGVATVTGLSDTSKMKAGYYIGGSNITNGTTILSVDSATQVTMSANATGTNSSTVYVSPWPLGNGTTTFTLPDFTTTGRFLRGRTSSTQLGAYQSNQNKTHTHAFTTDSSGTIATGDANQDHTHNSINPSAGTAFVAGGATPIFQPSGSSGVVTTGQSQTHHHTVPNHTHTGTTDASGGTEARPESISVMWCIKY